MTTETLTTAALALPLESRAVLADTLLRSLDTQPLRAKTNGAGHLPAATNILPQFQQCLSEWKSESQFLSSSVKMAMLHSYQRIIGLGPAVIPLILIELARDPDHWFWALEALTGENPAANCPPGDITSMTNAWLAWGSEQGYDRVAL